MTLIPRPSTAAFAMTTALLPAEAVTLPEPVPMTTLTGPPFRGAAAAIVGAIKLGLAVCGAVAPAATAGWCHKRYFTPNRAPLRDSDRRLLAEAEAMALPWKSPGGAPYPVSGELRGFRWGAGPTVLLVHGWDSRAARIAAPLVRPLVDAGFQVVAFDMPGHGESPGLQSDLLSFIAAIRQIVDHVGAPHAIVAHSMGAVSAVGALAEGVPCNRYVGLGSAVWLRTFPERFCKILGVGGKLRERLHERLYQTFAPEEWDRRSAHALAPKLTTPALLFHCRDDNDTAWTGSVALARAWPGAQLELTQKLGHYRLMGDADVQQKLVAFLRS